MLTPSLILKAYCAGIFPMSDNRQDDSIYWVRPKLRGIFEVNHLHIPKSTRKMIKKTPYYVTVNHSFSDTVKGCIESRSHNRTDTWINQEIEGVFIQLHQQGHAHSFETRNREGQLIGGLYGLSIGGAFFGESMFSLVSGASKFALIACHAYLKERHFQLFDVQFTNEHLKQFGCKDISCNAYDILLKKAITFNVNFLEPAPQPIIRVTDYIL